MRRLMIRYRVKPERAAENQQYVENVFRELATTRPGGLRYASFKLADGVSFVHVVSIETEGENPLQQSAAFKAFTADIEERCDGEPVTTELTEVGSYRFFGDA
jgi:hypothetical protein